MTTPVATATVRILPDTTGFRAALEAELALATKGLSASVGTAAASGLAGTTAAAGGTSKALKGVKADTAAAAKGLGDVEKASLAARLGLTTAEGESNALRGALIGLSRVTPVTVFGLGLAGTVAIAAGLAIKGAVSETAKFDHQLAIFQVTTGATADQMKKVEAEAKALGADLTLPGVSAGDAAVSMTELAKAGLSVKDTLAGARGVLQLATAAQIGVGQAADYVATALNAFQLSGAQATHIADLLTGASNAAQGSIVDFGTAFQQVSAVAHNANLSVEQTTGALTELAKAGLRGADGGTSLRTTLLRLTPTTKQAAEFQDALGIKLDKTKTIGQQLGNVLDQYHRALTALNPIQRQQVLTQIAGQDAIRAFSILVRGGSAALDENTKAANQNGAAQRTASANARGLNGAFQNFSNTLSNFGLDLGNVVKGPLTKFINQTTTATGVLDKLAEHAVKAGDKIKHAFDGIGPKDNTGKSLGARLFAGVTESLPSGVGKAENSATALVAALAGGLPKDTGDAQLRAAIAAAREFARTHHDVTEGIRGAGILGGSTATPGSVLQPLTKEEALTIRRAAEAAIARAKIKKANLDITAPLNLQNAELNAQISGSLKAELAADQKIENYFEKRLKSADKGTARYTKILAAFASATSQTRSIQQQIDSNAKQARDKAIADAKQAAADAKAQAQAIFNLGKSTLDLAIQRAGQTPGQADDIAANQAEVSFFERQIAQIKKHTKLTLEERQALTDDQAAIVSLKATIDADKQAQKQALVNLEKSRLDLAIQQAGLTKGTADDIRANRAEINFFQRQIARIEAIKKHRKLTIEEKQAIIDDQSAIASLQSTIQGIKGQSQGASAADIFKEAASEFSAFGSNIAQRGGLLSGQDARASFAARVLNKASAQTVAKVIASEQASRDRAQLTEAQKQTQLLRGIRDELAGHGARGEAAGKNINRPPTIYRGAADFSRIRR